MDLQGRTFSPLFSTSHFFRNWIQTFGLSVFAVGWDLAKVFIIFEKSSSKAENNGEGKRLLHQTHSSCASCCVNCTEYCPYWLDEPCFVFCSVINVISGQCIGLQTDRSLENTFSLSTGSVFPFRFPSETLPCVWKLMDSPSLCSSCR